MDHEAVVRQQLTERYLLNELDSATRDEFEEHYFDCPICAADVRTGALFVDRSKLVLQGAEGSATLPEKAAASAERVPASAGGFFWLRPVIAVPVLAMLLALVAYQDRANRQLQQAANSPQVLASAVVNVNTRGAEAISVPARSGQAFELTLNLPPENRFSSYTLDLYNSQGQLEWSRTIPGSGSDTLSLYVPGSGRSPATLAVHGITTSGESEDLGRYPIELKEQK
ncbi:MAG: hypothetical protein WBS24_11035 [Terriglobales bacterium]